jgi:hypothetical protein
METVGTPPQVEELAVTVKGEVSDAPFEGVATVMASADTLDATSTKKAERKHFIRVLEPLASSLECEKGLLRR